MVVQGIPIKEGQKLLTKQIGKYYIFGHEVHLDDQDPKAFDCSELVQWFYHQFGFRVPDGSYNQYDYSAPVDKPRPFDLFFCRRKDGPVFHVGIMFDDFIVVHAKGRLFGVVREAITSVEKYNTFAGWRRPLCLI